MRWGRVGERGKRGELKLFGFAWTLFKADTYRRCIIAPKNKNIEERSYQTFSYSFFFLLNINSVQQFMGTNQLMITKNKKTMDKSL